MTPLPSTTSPVRPRSRRGSLHGRRRVGRLLVVLSTLALITAGCGDSTDLDQLADDLVEASQPSSTTTTAGDGTDQTADDFSDGEQAVLDYLRRGALIPESEAACLIDGINAAGVDPGSIVGSTLTDAQDVALTDLLFTCFEHPEILTGFVANFAAGFSATSGLDISVDQAGCMVAALAANDATSYDVDSVDLPPALQDAFETCLGTGDTGTGATLEPGNAYGDNAALDVLWDECQAGATASCDELYAISEVGSEYETFGATCGQTEPEASGGTCNIPASYGDNAALDALWDSCEGGDGAACDKLYFDSPVGSVYEEFGNTCGNRYPESPGFCEDALG